MLRPSRIAVSVATLVAAAILGGAAALGGAAVFTDFGEGSTTVRTVDDGSAAPAEFATDGNPLSINEIYRRSAPGVVQITSTVRAEQNEDPFGFPFGFPEQRPQRALGSGFVIDKAGHIVTNYHVIEGAERIEVSFSNNERMRARLVGSDPSTDTAVLKVNASSRALTPLPLGDSDTVRVGDAVVAIGNPFGLQRTTTAGIVSALQRQIRAPNLYAIDHVIQTDAQINSGNSGGPLLSTRGEVVGVNAQIATGGTGQGNVGIGFAIPINTVKDVTAQLIKSGKVERAFIGVEATPITPEIARLFRLPVSRGLLVQNVIDGSGAERAGLRAGTTRVVVAGESYVLGGDVIVEADGERVSSIDRLRDAVAKKSPGDTMTLGIYRGDERMTLEVRLGRQPASPG